jgi:mRNA interferase RelE/StbE
VPYTLRYHPRVAEDDLADIPVNLHARIARSIDGRPTSEPMRYGVPLRRTLKSYWKLRVGDYRVVFKVAGQEIWVLTILHRREVPGTFHRLGRARPRRDSRAATASVSRMTRRMLPRESFARSRSDQPRRTSSAKSRG